MAAAPAALAKYTSFTPRTHFPLPSSLPRSYFLGHHRAGLDKMKSLLGSIDLVVECRDYRIPWTGRNILFERELGLGAGAGAVGTTKRVVVFTKWDLGADGRQDEKARNRDSILRRLHHPTHVHFSSARGSTGTTHALLSAFREFARANFSLTGHRVLVAGMPNVGKSTLLNALRAAGLPGRSKGKVAKTGAQPGVTRKVGTGVKILEAETDDDYDAADFAAATSQSGSSSIGPAKVAVGEGVYLLDTPGVFMPYVPSATAMLKLALVGSVKDSILPPVTLADFLLFNINTRGDPDVYTPYMPDGQPTNDVLALLEGIGRRTGRLTKGGEVDIEGTAVWMVQRWRQGLMGRFVLDDVDGEEIEEQGKDGKGPVSFSQAKKLQRDRKKEASKAKWLGKA